MRLSDIRTNILHRFLDTATYWPKNANFHITLSFNALTLGNSFEFLDKPYNVGLSVSEDCDPSWRYFDTVPWCQIDGQLNSVNTGQD